MPRHRSPSTHDHTCARVPLHSFFLNAMRLPGHCNIVLGFMASGYSTVCLGSSFIIYNDRFIILEIQPTNHDALDSVFCVEENTRTCIIFVHTTRNSRIYRVMQLYRTVDDVVVRTVIEQEKGPAIDEYYNSKHEMQEMDVWVTVPG